MLDKVFFYLNMGGKLLRRNTVNQEDYRREYNKVAETYAYWLKEMGKYTDQIIKPEYVVGKEKLKILDFACGTGYITKSLLDKGIPCEITAVDFSEKMLETWKESVNEKVKVIHQDGMSFLKRTKEKYDMIFFGWALSYFHHKELFQCFGEVLNPGGFVAIITNVRGTLDKVEDIFLKVMEENQAEILRPMDIRFNLPDGKEGLVNWFRNYGFHSVEAGEGEVFFTFDTPVELLEWLNKTGAAAGTAQIFKDYDKIRQSLIEEIRRKKCKDDKFEINHKFAYGIFKCKS